MGRRRHLRNQTVWNNVSFTEAWRRIKIVFSFYVITKKILLLLGRNERVMCTADRRWSFPTVLWVRARGCHGNGSNCPWHRKGGVSKCALCGTRDTALVGLPTLLFLFYKYIIRLGLENANSAIVVSFWILSFLILCRALVVYLERIVDKSWKYGSSVYVQRHEYCMRPALYISVKWISMDLDSRDSDHVGS